MLNEKIEVSSEDVYRLFEVKKYKASIANAALNNEIIPFPGFEATKFDKTIWKVLKSEKYGNSYTLYLHTLRIAAELMSAYEFTGELKYFYKAEEIIYSWIDFSNTNEHSKMMWYDHTTANRVQVLIQYIYLANKLNRKLKYKNFKELLYRHADVLTDDKIYKFNNHGLMMDRSLIILGYILQDKSIVLKAKNRAIQTFWYSFSSQGIHLENSPQYHSMVVGMYKGIEKYLNKKDETLGKHIVNHLRLSKNYISFITKPNGHLASIGDSSDNKQKVIKRYKNIFDYESGISILQYEEPFPLYTTFIAGYSSKVHKHKDDLSITLNYKKKDFLIDPGKYSYTNNKIRRYITSQNAHNSFYLKEFEYTIKDENRLTRKIRLENKFENNQYTLVSGINNDFDGSSAKLVRTVIQLKNFPVILLIDSLYTNVKHKLKLEQNFNLASDVIVEKRGYTYKFFSADEEMTLKQFLPIGQGEIIKGDFDKPIAINTKGFAKVEKTNQIKFKRKTNNRNVFITAIFDERIVKEIKVNNKENLLLVTINNKYIKINF